MRRPLMGQVDLRWMAMPGDLVLVEPRLAESTYQPDERSALST